MSKLFVIFHSVVKHKCLDLAIELKGIAPIPVQNDKYRQVSNISRTKSQHLKYSLSVLRLSLPNPLKPDVKSRMKI